MNIIYEDDFLIAINKKCNELVQSDKNNEQSLLSELIKTSKSAEKKFTPGLVHRLDRPASGVIIFTKNRNILAKMNLLFQEGKIKKIYNAVVKNKPPKDEDTLVHYLIKNERQNKSFANDIEIKNSQKSVLNYKLISKTDNYYFLEIDLLTGRHHQIRCQLAKIGCAIKGDLKYGFPRSNKEGGIHLHSRKISFVHPVTKVNLEIIAPFPEDVLWNLLK